MLNKIKWQIIPFIKKYLLVFSTFVIVGFIYCLYLENFRVHWDPPEIVVYVYSFLWLMLTPIILLLVTWIRKYIKLEPNNYFIFFTSLITGLIHIIAWEYFNQVELDQNTLWYKVISYGIDNDILLLIIEYILFFTLFWIIYKIYLIKRSST